MKIKIKLVENKDPCWKNYEQYGTKEKNGKEVPNCVPKKKQNLDESEDLEEFLLFEEEESLFLEKLGEKQLEEAKYRGKTVKLNKIIRTPGKSKKFKVYVRDGDKVKIVRFGDPNMKIKKSNPKRKKSFRARHNCDNPGPKTKARYWSCKNW